MKPTRSAPASTAASTSSWRVSPQTLTSGRRRISRSAAPGSGARISVEPTRTAFAPGELGGGRLCGGRDPALGDQHDRVARREREQLELRRAVDPEGREVARVDADHRGAERDGRGELVGVVRLDERVEAERFGLAPGARARPRRRDRAAGAAPRRRRPRVPSRRCSRVEKKPLASSGRRRRRPRRAQVVPGAAEPLVDEHRHRAGTGGLVGGCDPRHVAVRANVARRRRAPLELRDRAEARARERVRESHAAAPRVRSATSWASRSAAAPESRALASAEPLGQILRVTRRRDRAGGVQEHRRAAAAVGRRRRSARSPRRSRPACRRAARSGRSEGCRASSGSISRSCTAPSTTSQTRFGPAGESSSMPPAPCTTKARCAPSLREHVGDHGHERGASRRRRSGRARRPGSSAGRAR